MPIDGRRWHHVVLTTYGAWLYGDLRGFRTRHHREHIEGDYKHRPEPGRYLAKERRSRAALKQDVVVLPASKRALVGHALQRELTRLGAWVLVIAVAGRHAHALVKLPPGKARHFIGRAKREATTTLRSIGWEGRVWGVRSKAVLICDRKHQVNTYRYIVAHAAEGAWVQVWMVDPTNRDE